MRLQIILPTLCILLTSCTKSTSTTEHPDKPNIIFILADDLGYGELGVYGQEKIKTPHIDKLATNGMRFTQHYTGAPVCAPARCILLTGKHSGHAYIRGNDEWVERGDVWNYQKAVADPNLEGQRPMPDETVTIGNILQEAGYKTALVGKWGLGAPLSNSVPTKMGFDFFFGYNCQRQAHQLYPAHLWRNEEKVLYNNEIVSPGTKLNEGADPDHPDSYKAYKQKDYAPEKMLDEALQFITSNKNESFFLYYASPLPHLPLQAPENYIEKYNGKFGEEEPYLGDKGYFPTRFPKATYAGMISHLDDEVGALVDKLKELGLYENTLIIFTSDNGPTYTGGVDAAFFNSANPFSNEYGRTKGYVYEGGIRVPLSAHGPGRIKPGSTSDHQSAFWDVLATLNELVGNKVQIETDGISFLPTLLNKGSQKKHDYLYWEFPEYNGQQAVRFGNWKAIRKNIRDGNLSIELYDLETDPGEIKNLAEQHPDIVKQIEAIMLKEHVPSTIDRFKLTALGDLSEGK